MNPNDDRNRRHHPNDDSGRLEDRDGNNSVGSSNHPNYGAVAAVERGANRRDDDGEGGNGGGPPGGAAVDSPTSTATKNTKKYGRVVGIAASALAFVSAALAGAAAAAMVLQRPSSSYLGGGGGGGGAGGGGSTAATTAAAPGVRSEFDLSSFSSSVTGKIGGGGGCPYATAAATVPKLGMAHPRDASSHHPTNHHANHHHEDRDTDAADVAAKDAKAAAAAASDRLLGPLASLVGTWVGDRGLSVVSVPKRMSRPNDTGKFELVVRPYKEVVTFAALGDPVRNRGGYIEQYSGVVTYYKEVVATDDDPGAIHAENGMLFYLSNVTDYGTNGRPALDQPAPYPVARSATIPHGNVAFLFGSFDAFDDKPVIPDIDSRATNSGAKEGGHYDDPFRRSPYEYATNPNGMLQTAIANQTIVKTVHMAMDSNSPYGSIANTPFIYNNADTTGFKADLWIETVLEEDGTTTEQLQYSEFVDILFHKQKGEHPSDTELISWPHVNVNTLIKVKN